MAKLYFIFLIEFFVFCEFFGYIFFSVLIQAGQKDHTTVITLCVNGSGVGLLKCLKRYINMIHFLIF